MITRFAGTCEWCAEATTPGVDYAFLASDGKWHASCASCSASIPARISGIAQRIGKVQDSLTEAQLATLSVPANLADAIGGVLSDSEAKLVSAAMVQLRRDVDALVKAATPEVEPTTLVKGGIYDVNGVLFSIRESKSGNLYAMQATGDPEAGRKLSWEYVRGAIGTVARSGVRLTAEQASNIGHLTSHCCFCSLELTDGRSIDVGYGPVCAANQGLPWG
jgi:hypothetical protein